MNRWGLLSYFELRVAPIRPMYYILTMYHYRTH